MKIDITSTVGFPVQFDPEKLEITPSAGYHFGRQTRRAAVQSQVLRCPDALDPETPVYYLYYPDGFPPQAQSALDLNGLTFSFVLLPSLTVGDEYVKTTGHYHPAIPGTDLPYPEVYTQLYGELYLLLQKRKSNGLDEIEDCQLVKMTPGFSITIPPGYAHVLINTSSEPALMAGLYSRNFTPIYEPVTEKRGLAHYLISGNGDFKVEANPLYQDRPILNYLDDIRDTPFEYDDPGVMLWTSFMSQPDKYAFLSESKEVMERFD